MDDLTQLPKALAPLIEEERWLNWRWEPRQNKDGTVGWTKVPYRPRNPRAHAASDDPNTWSAHRLAVRRVRNGDADGIGFALLKSGIGAIDLDKCCQRDAEKRLTDIEPWARDMRAQAGSAYCEVTVSGTGLRLIGKADGENLHRNFSVNGNGARVELFRNCRRYITVSGLQLKGDCTELPTIDDFLDTLRGRFDGNHGPTERQSRTTDDATDYESVLRHGAPEGGRSEAFQRVVWHLAATGMSVERIEALLREHPNGIAEKYLSPDRLAKEVARSYGKWQAQADRAVGLADFNAFMPTHSYLFRPTCEMWTAASVNARISPPAPKLPANA